MFILPIYNIPSHHYFQSRYGAHQRPVLPRSTGSPGWKQLNRRDGWMKRWWGSSQAFSWGRLFEEMEKVGQSKRLPKPHLISTIISSPSQAIKETLTTMEPILRAASLLFSAVFMVRDKKCIPASGIWKALAFAWSIPYPTKTASPPPASQAKTPRVLRKHMKGHLHISADKSWWCLFLLKLECNSLHALISYLANGAQANKQRMQEWMIEEQSVF